MRPFLVIAVVASGFSLPVGFGTLPLACSNQVAPPPELGDCHGDAAMIGACQPAVAGAGGPGTGGSSAEGGATGANGEGGSSAGRDGSSGPPSGSSDGGTGLGSGPEGGATTGGD